MTPRLFSALLLGATVVSPSAGVVAAPPDMDDVPLTISGCVVAGEDKDSYMLTNISIDGTALAPAEAFYRFNTTKGFKENVGNRVEVKGKADLDDVDAGRVKVEVKDGKRRTEISSERRTVRVQELRFGTVGAMKLEAEIPTYKFDVDSVRRINGVCG